MIVGDPAADVFTVTEQLLESNSGIEGETESAHFAGTMTTAPVPLFDQVIFPVGESPINDPFTVAVQVMIVDGKGVTAPDFGVQETVVEVDDVDPADATGMIAAEDENASSSVNASTMNCS